MNLKHQLFQFRTGAEPEFDQFQIALLERRLAPGSKYDLHRFRPRAAVSSPAPLRRDQVENRMFKRTVYKDLFVPCSYD